jgi:bacteriocin biosynthesis cyclodehydratase domain-containing protein
MKYKKNLNWNLLLEDGKLLITKGADEIYFIDESDKRSSEIIFNAYKEDLLDDLAVKKKHLKTIIEKLERAGVIYKRIESIKVPTNKIEIFIEWIGNKNDEIFGLLESFIKKSEDIHISNDKNKADVLFLVRSSGKMSELLKNYNEIKIPHILIDLAYDHTLSIGPLVFPGETACLGCFVGRITRNWGDAMSPQTPRASQSNELIAALIFENIKTFQVSGSCPELINQVWSFNLKDFTTKYDKIFRLPWCPICFPEKPQEGTGSFELPWKISNNQLK